MKFVQASRTLRGRAEVVGARARTLAAMMAVLVGAAAPSACANAVVDDVAAGGSDAGTKKGPSTTTKGDDDDDDDSTIGEPPDETTPERDAGAGTDAGSGGTQDGGSGTGAGCKQRVVINEVMPEGSDAGEFVELYNPYDCDVSLGGLVLKYQSKDPSSSTTLYTFAGTNKIVSKGFFVIGTKDEPKKNVTMSGGLGNAGGQVAVVDGSGQILDGVGFGALRGDFYEKATAPVPGKGKSIGRKIDGVDTNDNSKDFQVFSDPTPGSSNK